MTRPRLSILVINPDLPKYGSRFHEYTNLTGLAAEATVGLVTQLTEPEDWRHVRRLEAAGVAVHAFDGIAPPAPAGPSSRPSPAARLRQGVRALAGRLERLLAPFRPLPAEIYVTRRTLANLAGPLRRALAERSWDRIVIIQSSFAEWLDWLPAHIPAVLVLHDVRTMVWQRRAQVAEGWGAWLSARLAARRYRTFEGRHLPRFAQVVCLTDIDAALVRDWFGITRVAVVPLPVDTGYFQPIPVDTGYFQPIPVDTGYFQPIPGPEPEPDGPVLLFPGVMNHPPNIDAALWFARAIFPRIRQSHPGARFVIAGLHPVAPILALDSRAPDGCSGVTVTGGVPDMRPLFGAATVVVVPLRVGSGARNKILEAWACARPVVSTPVGAEGLNVADGRDLRLAEDAAGFAGAVAGLLEAPGLRAALVAGGLASVEAHTPERVLPRYRAAVAAAGPLPATARGPMRVCLDLRWMIPGSAGGLEQQARALVDTLLEIDQVNRYTLILPAECRADFDLRNRETFRVLCRDSLGADAGRLGRALGRRLGARLGGSARRWPDRWALADLADLDCEIAYSFNGFIHPELWDLRQVLVVPDIQHEFFPDFFTPAALAERRRLFDQSLARAGHICAMSGYTRRTLIETLGVPAERISVTWLAADSVFQPQRPDQAAADAARLARRYGLRAGGYVYLPAHTWHHKNHATVISALALLRERGLELALVCTGGAREAQPGLERLAATLGLGDRVRFLGYVPREDLPRLYHGAAALVFPSRFEGFGMPVLEAMASGCPVISANAASLPEVVGEAALLVEPLDVAGWADAMQRLITDSGLRADLIARGLSRAASFSWRRHTLETLAVLAAVRAGR